MERHLLETLTTVGAEIAAQFGSSCEVVIHDLKLHPDHSIVAIFNGHVSGRKVGDVGSSVVMERLAAAEETARDRYCYLTRTPDVLVFTGTAAQLEPVLRASTYSTGESYHSECTPVMGCSWFMVYPYMTGKINFVVPAFVHGPHGRQLWPSDTVVVSVPYQWVPTVITNLGEMPLELSGHAGKEQYYAEFGGILKDLDEKMKNP